MGTRKRATLCVIAQQPLTYLTNGLVHHCCSHGVPSLFPSILVSGQFFKKYLASVNAPRQPTQLSLSSASGPRKLNGEREPEHAYPVCLPRQPEGMHHHDSSYLRSNEICPTSAQCRRLDPNAGSDTRSMICAHKWLDASGRIRTISKSLLALTR
jgi:hypothetical protein